MDTAPQLLIALDLDGTAVRYEPQLEMEPALMQYMNTVRSHGVRWVMNSDRYTDTMIQIAMQLEPDNRPVALLSCQRFIHLLDGRDQYMSYDLWNREQTKLHTELWGTIAPFFDDWRREIEKRFTIFDFVINDLVFAYMVPPDQTPELRHYMQACIEPWPDAQVSGNQEWTFILHAAFSKGRVLNKCAQILGVARQNIIAIGDGINDISMLDGSITKLVGCPANASAEVVEVVQQTGGMVADQEAAAGAVQILRHYIASVVKSCGASTAR